jgi:hypothetical protein
MEWDMPDRQSSPQTSGKPPAEESRPFRAPAISQPKGGWAVRGIGEKFAANPVTGTGSMSVPIATSPGRSGFGPQLSLSYDSGPGNGPFGFGWSLSVPSITRKTDKGLPQYKDADESDVSILSGAEDLVPVLRPDGMRHDDDTTAADYTIRRYRPRIAGLKRLMSRSEVWLVRVYLAIDRSNWMSGFSDAMVLQFLDTAFVSDLLTNKLGPEALFDLIYSAEDFEVQKVVLATVSKVEFEAPALETIRTSGTNEQIMPSAARVKVDRTQPRYGRLAWVDVVLDISVTATLKTGATPIESITVQDLLAKLGGVVSIADLKTKLALLYPASVVDAFFQHVPITSVDDFRSRPGFFVQFVYQTPPPFNPADPANQRDFPLNVCVQIQPDLKITEALQNAKLCRSILENERDFPDTFSGGDLHSPYAFVVVFQDSLFVNSAVGALTALQLKAGTKSLFHQERMIAHFA